MGLLLLAGAITHILPGWVVAFAIGVVYYRLSRTTYR
jgi:hypothetical protein